MDIHPKFSTWLAGAQITPGDEVIRKWWAAISELPVNRETIVSLARSAFRRDAETSFETAFAAAIQKHDAGFVPGPVAISLLAATRLAVELQQPSVPLVYLVAFAILGGSSGGHSNQVCLTELGSQAEKTIEIGSKTRANWEYVRTGEGDENNLDNLRTAIGVCSEESNILWWLFGQTSRDLNREFGAIAEESVAIVVGKELADLTMILPGPFGIAAFADRACRTNREKLHDQLDVAAAIASLPVPWKTAVAASWKDAPVQALAPIARAISSSIQIQGSKWPSEFARATGWSKTYKLSHVQLALLIYRESMLLKAWTQLAP
jgi:hypothetical protein